MSPDADARLALSLVAEPGDARLVALLASASPTEVLDALRGGRLPSGRRPPDAWAERVPTLDRDVEAAVRRADAEGLRWITPSGTEWPSRLDDLDHVAPQGGCTGRPLGLWVRGTGDLAQLVDAGVAVVGARSCSAYGAECAAEIAADLADHAVTVVSGAAFGIDAAAHRGALAQGARTVAVLACGADVDYPRGNAALLRRIAEQGLVVSEHPPGQVPLRSRFLSRNRIIAGLVSGTVVVEAARRSGSLNTLHWADALGRTTMAVPGPVTSQLSAGTHHALREGEAVLVTGGADVLAELAGLGEAEPGPPGAADSEYDRLSALARRVLDSLSFTQPRSITDVAAAARGSRSDVTDVLARLAARGLCDRVGERWLIVRRADLTA